jgi:hypothetical protein
MYCILGLVLILVAVYLESNRKMDQLFYALALLVVLLLGSVISNKPKESFLGFAPTQYNMGSCGGKHIKPEDSIARNPYSSWEGVTYKTTTDEPNRQHQWRRPPSNLPLVKDTYITSPIGEDILLGDDLVSPYYPSVDGKPESQRRMFMFAQNQCRPDCCPATYSCDGGCVCTTEEQRNLIAGRGGNASKGNDL